MTALLDQAAGLSEWVRRQRGPEADAELLTPVIAVTSATGGVGKTFIAENLAIALSQRGVPAQVLDVDASQGSASEALDALRGADQVLVVTTPDSAALTQTYTLIKTLTREASHVPVALVINRSESPEQAAHAAAHLDRVTRRFLDRSLPCRGTIPNHPAGPQSLSAGRPLVELDPGAPAARALIALGGTIARFPSLHSNCSLNNPPKASREGACPPFDPTSPRGKQPPRSTLPLRPAGPTRVEVGTTHGSTPANPAREGG